MGETVGVVGKVKGKAEMRLEVLKKGGDFRGAEVRGESFGPEIGR